MKPARSGIALFIALGLLTLLGLLIAGAVAATVLAQRAARFVADEAALMASAEYGLTTVLADPRGFGLADLALGVPSAFDVAVPAPGVSARVAVTRLPNGILWMVGDASTAAPDRGRRRVSVVARFPSPGLLPVGGIVARGSVVARDDVTFGTDTITDAECAPLPGPAVILAPGATATVARGVLTSVAASALDSATYFLTERQLALLDRGTRVIHVRGDTSIAGGTLDGILVVDGTLTVAGPFTVVGLVVARGPVIATTPGLDVTGSLMSFAAAPATAVDLSGATIRYSPCAVARAERLAVPPVTVPQRSWAQLF